MPSIRPRLALHRRHRFRPIEYQISHQTDILERHERQIARHTSLQTIIGGFTLAFSIITTALLIYVTYQQYKVAEKQYGLYDRQVKLEYAKVAPRFSISSTVLQEVEANPDRRIFPNEIGIRISRGEAVLERVDIRQDLRIWKGPDHSCVFRVKNYFSNTSHGKTDFSATLPFRRVSRDASWFQDKENYKEYISVSPGNTLLYISFKDIFGRIRNKKYVGEKGELEEIPSKNFPKSGIYETVDVRFIGNGFRVPGSFEFLGKEPETRGCRAMFGLGGGRARYF